VKVGPCGEKNRNRAGAFKRYLQNQIPSWRPPAPLGLPTFCPSGWAGDPEGGIGFMAGLVAPAMGLEEFSGYQGLATWCTEMVLRRLEGTRRWWELTNYHHSQANGQAVLRALCSRMVEGEETGSSRRIGARYSYASSATSSGAVVAPLCCGAETWFSPDGGVVEEDEATRSGPPTGIASVTHPVLG